MTTTNKLLEFAQRYRAEADDSREKGDHEAAVIISNISATYLVGVEVCGRLDLIGDRLDKLIELIERHEKREGGLTK